MTLYCILRLNFRHISPADTHTHTQACAHPSLTRQSLGSWCWVSWWSPATLEEDREGRTGEGGNGKRPLVFIWWHISLSTRVLSRNPSIPAGPWVCFHNSLFLLHFSQSSLLPSNYLTAQTGWGAFLTSCCLTLPSLSMADTLMAAKWFINKWFCLAEMCNSTSFTLLSYHSSLGLWVTVIKHNMPA